MNLMDITVNIKIYLIKSKEGKWFGAKGSFKSHWVDDVQEARLYTKKRPARSQITWWTNNYPEYGIPDLIELTVENGKILIEEEQRVIDSINKIKREKIESELRTKQWRLEQAQKDLDDAKQRIKDLENAH